MTELLEILDQFEIIIILAIMVAVLASWKRLTKKINQPVLDEITKLQQEVLTNRRGNMRNELLLMVNTQPEKVQAIEDVYQTYRELGGNTYVDDVIQVWRKKYANRIISERIKNKKGA